MEQEQQRSVQLQSICCPFQSKHRRVCRAETEREPDWHRKPLSAPRHTHEHRHTQTTSHPQDTDQLALIVIVPVEFVRFLCHLEARQSGLGRRWPHTGISQQYTWVHRQTQMYQRADLRTSPRQWWRSLSVDLPTETMWFFVYVFSIFFKILWKPIHQVLKCEQYLKKIRSWWFSETT